MRKKRVGVILINLGTPASCDTRDIRRYLKEFLMDERVIDIPGWKRWLLVNGIIAPFRAPKVRHEYLKLETPEGLPLRVISKLLEKKVQNRFEHSSIHIELAMRYGSPSIKKQLESLKNKSVEKVIIFPLFPQYASATNGTAIAKAFEEIKKWPVIPELATIPYFHDHPTFIKAISRQLDEDIKKEVPDHILFSFHGLPQRQINALGGYCSSCEGVRECKTHNPYCYKSACYHTAHQIAQTLNLTRDQYTIAFQSRLGKTPWIQPYTDDTIHQLAKKGIKRLHVIAPSFVTDCLETTIEIGEQYHQLFLDLGGEKFSLSNSLNDTDEWVNTITEMIQSKI
ncbi:ferrochelatase [Halosquirtibacter laminarini]|uniref:Ferrochelatase n=1 Tax=Halosquirtibacter laminarini TaxID=3374600 RepID=A0AC61NM48_9BACT|nr:ferrochelatase [Prolixibacteraceae bacterium]